MLIIVLSGRLILVHQYGTITPPSLSEQEVLLCSFLMHQRPILNFVYLLFVDMFVVYNVVNRISSSLSNDLKFLIYFF